MPVYNAGKFLTPAITSILTQTYQNIEFIIVDDGSTDGSRKIIQAYKKQHPKKIVVVKAEKKTNAAGNGATNLGLQYAHGDYIARMDADDISLPTRIEKQVAYMESHMGIILVGSEAIIIDNRGKAVGYKHTPSDHDAIYQQYAIVHPVIHPSVMVKRSMLPDPARLYAMRFDINDDYYTFFRLFASGRFANIPEPLIKYRVHEHNLSLSDVKKTILNTVAIRLEAVKNLNYQMPAWAFGIMVGQWLMGILLPNAVLRHIYMSLRGMQSPNISVRLFRNNLKKYRIPPSFLHIGYTK